MVHDKTRVMNNSTITKLLLTLITTTFLASNATLVAEPSIKTIEIIEDGLSIDGKKLDRNSTLADYEKALGKADRVAALMNTIYTFDNLGIYLYQKKDKKVIYSVVFMLKDKPSSKFQPKKPFRTAMTIGRQKLGRNFPEASIKGLKGVTPIGEIGKFGATKASYGKDVRLFFEHSRDPTILDRLSISWK